MTGDKCTYCGGDGWYADHEPNCQDENGHCVGNCPIQVQCHHCKATGIEL